MVENAKEAGKFAEEVEDTGGVYFVTVSSRPRLLALAPRLLPSPVLQGFSGLFAPYWDMAATGMLIGLSTFTTKHHICRATLEATCFQTRAILEAMGKDIGEDGEPLEVLKVDGGMTGSDVTMQLQADILGIPVERPTMRE